MMEWFNTLRARLRALFRRESVLQNIEEELRVHVEMATEENLKHGLPPDEARAAALKSFGNPGRNAEFGYDVRGGGWLEDIWQDVRYGARMLRKNPVLTLTAVLATALGISANTTIFSSADATLLRPLSFPNQERLLMLFERNPEAGISRGSVSPGNVSEWRAQAETLEEIIVIRNRDYILTGEGPPERYTSYGVSAAFFDALGIKPYLGRTFHSGEDESGRAQVVVLRYAFWQTRFAGDPQIVGKQVLFDDKPFEVIGVMPKDFEFPYGDGEMWTPFVFEPQMKQDHANHYLRVLALLKPGANLAQANAELHAISQRIQEEFPKQENGHNAYAVTLNDEYTRVAKTYVPVLIGSALFVLLIACSNVANLLLARASSRQKEIAVRLALGASRWRIIRQLLTESVLLSLAGGALGCLLAGWGIEALAKGIPTDVSKFIPGWGRLGLSYTVLTFTALLSVVTGILFGLAPAWQATKINFNQTLKEGTGYGTPGKGGRSRMRHALVVAEIALSLILLIGAGLFVRSFIQILRADLGVKPENVITMGVELPRDKYPGKEQQRNFFQQLLQGIKGSPGVAEAGAVDSLPMSGRNNFSKFQIVGQPAFEKGKEPHIEVRVVTSGYFDAIGTELRKGRLFTPQDDGQTSRVILVNEAFAAHYLKDVDAVGQRLKLNDAQDAAYEIAGVVANVINDDLNDKREPGVYLPFAQYPSRQMSLVIRVPGADTQIVPAVRNELAALDSRLPLSGVKTMTQLVYERRSPKEMMMWMLVIFGVMALLMAAVGTYAVIAYAVTQRTHEIGVRMALGARSIDILTLVLRRGLALALLGIGLGLVGAFALTRALGQLLFAVSATDPLTFVGISLLLAVVALLACYIPARRAAKVDPLVALRHE
jgi:putative ABC transport system permease protein